MHVIEGESPGTAISFNERLSAYGVETNSPLAAKRPMTQSSTKKNRYQSQENLRPFRPRSFSTASEKNYKPFEFTENLYRKSFFNFLSGPNENRFVQFNDIPQNNSKYTKGRKLTQPVTNFSKVISRDTSIIGMASGDDKLVSANIEYDLEFLNIEHVNNVKATRHQQNISYKKFDHYEKLNNDI